MRKNRLGRPGDKWLLVTMATMTVTVMISLFLLSPVFDRFRFLLWISIVLVIVTEGELADFLVRAVKQAPGVMRSASRT